MNLLRCVLFLLLTTTLAFGQAVGHSKHVSLPNDPEAFVRSFYQQVVARHPVGIPRGVDMKIFAPYLSKALLHKIDLAIACSYDWDRKHPDPNVKP